MQGVSDVYVSKRERMARRADKWWRSAWHVQMLMCGRGIGFDVGADASRASSRPDFAKPLTDVFRVGRVKTQTTKTKPKVGRSDYTEGETK